MLSFLERQNTILVSNTTFCVKVGHAYIAKALLEVLLKLYWKSLSVISQVSLSARGTQKHCIVLPRKKNLSKHIVLSRYSCGLLWFEEGRAAGAGRGRQESDSLINEHLCVLTYC